MANPEHLEILKQGVEVWNRWREESYDVSVDLSGANLAAMNLQKVDLNDADLKWTNLINADLTKAKLNRANLLDAGLDGADLIEASLREAILAGVEFSEVGMYGADLSKTILNDAHFYLADLRQVNLSEADLRETTLNRISLNGANFCEAKVGWTVFGDVDLTGVIGLDTVTHFGPSSIDFHTIQSTRGRVSEVFLRGTGISDKFIMHITSPTDEAIQYYSCFISFSHKDDAFAQRLHADLQQNNVRCWFAPEDMKIGDKIRHRIDESIHIHDKLLLILSEHSLNSEWVESEVERAFEEERKRKHTVLFPVRLDEAVMETDQPWAADIRRTRHIGDFSRWKDHDAYQKAFERLLRDLKAEG